VKRFSILRFREDEVGVMISEIPLGLKDITVVGVAVEGDGKLIEADF